MSNNSPSLIAREFFNLVVIFISVLVWYFLSQVSAQVLKVRIKALFRNLNVLYSKQRRVEVAVNNQVDESYRDKCVCSCTCGYEQHRALSETSLDINNSVKSEGHSVKSELINDPNVSIVNLDHYQDHVNIEDVTSLSDASDCDLPVSPDGSLKNEPHVSHNCHGNEIPSIIITSVEPPKLLTYPPRSVSNSAEHYATPTLQPSDKFDQPYDSGQGSSEITYPVKHTPTHSESSLSTCNSSGVFSDCANRLKGHTPHVNGDNNFAAEEVPYMNGGFLPSPRIIRSKSVEVGRSNFCEETSSLESSYPRSKSLCDLTPKSSRVRLSSVSLDMRANGSCGKRNASDSFSIHTELFDSMMKS